VTIDRSMAARFGIQPQLIDDTLYDASDSARCAVFHPAQPVSRRPLVSPRLQADRRRSTNLRQVADHGHRCRLGTFVKIDPNTRNYLSTSHQASSPRDPVIQPEPGTALGDAVAAIDKATAGMGKPADRGRDVPGHRPGLPVVARLAALPDRRGAGGGLHLLGMSMRATSPAHHPVDPALGRARRAADPAGGGLRSQRHR